MLFRNLCLFLESYLVTDPARLSQSGGDAQLGKDIDLKEQPYG
jgi:hypothetical protein